MEGLKGLSERNIVERSLGRNCTFPLQPQAPHTSPPMCVSVSSHVEMQRAVQKNGQKTRTLASPPSPLASMAPVADSSTRVDSPSHGLVTSSLCSPLPARLSHTPQSQPSRPGTYKMSVATQCDPEEIIVLSDSD